MSVETGRLRSIIRDNDAYSWTDYEEYGYDPNGNRTSLRKRDNWPQAYGAIAYQYDALNRMTVKTVPERPAPHPYPLTAAQTRDVYFSYDLRGLMTAARFDSVSGEGITSAYDGFGRLASSTTNMGGTTRTLQYQYDRNGTRTRITHPDGIYFNTGHDGLGRTISIADPGTERFIMGYTPHGGPSAVVRDNLTLIIYGYGPLYRLGYIAMGHDFPGFTSDVTIMFDRNPAGQISTMTRSNPGSSPGQADAYAWTGAYTVNRPYTTNGLNQYSAAGTASFTYDANGNLIADGTNTFTYDIENRLVGRSGGVALAYDPLGRLLAVASPSTYTRFLYDGDALVAEYNSAGEMTRRYVHNAGADVPLLSYAGSGLTQLSYLHADHQGSIVAVSNAAGVSAINTYDEYGIPGAGNTGRFQYTGQIWLPEIGMYYYKARIYSPTLGRFLQADPVGYEDQFNLYAYVGNDPVNSVDPTGTTCTPVERENGAKEQACQVDFVMQSDGTRRPVTAEDLETLGPVNERYTNAVNELERHRSRTVNIPDLQGTKGGFRINAGQVADALIARQFTFVDANTARGAYLVTEGVPDSRGNVHAETFVLRNGLAAEEREFVHDGIHSTVQEARGGLLNSHYPLRNIPHDPQYNRAACTLLGRVSTCGR